MSSILPTAVAIEGSLYPEPMYDIPEDRRPLQLLLNASSSNSGEYVSKFTLTLYEQDMETRVQGVTYFVTLRDITYNSTVLRNVFYSEKGTAMLKLVRIDEGAVANITGTQEQFIYAWVADEGVTLYSPLLKEGATYEVTIEILSIDNIRKLLDPQNVPELRFIMDTGEDSMTARVEVVPEFPPSIVLLLASSVVSVFVVLTRIWKHKI